MTNQNNDAAFDWARPRPQLESMPAELIGCIADFLPDEARVALALTSRTKMAKSGGVSRGTRKNVLKEYGLDEYEHGSKSTRLRLLTLLQRDSTDFVRCDACQVLHNPSSVSRNKCGEIRSEWAVALPPMDGLIVTQPMVRAAVQWHNRGLDTSPLLDTLRRSFVDCDSNCGYVMHNETSAKVVNGSVLLKHQVVLAHHSLADVWVLAPLPPGPPAKYEPKMGPLHTDMEQLRAYDRKVPGESTLSFRDDIPLPLEEYGTWRPTYCSSLLDKSLACALLHPLNCAEAGCACNNPHFRGKPAGCWEKHRYEGLPGQSQAVDATINMAQLNLPGRDTPTRAMVITSWMDLGNGRRQICRYVPSIGEHVGVALAEVDTTWVEKGRRRASRKKKKGGAKEWLLHRLRLVRWFTAET
ncbi:hypothetical protein B0T16DRAFT_395482 [Cercophora newfieldiana]|uniref:Uncharacterized protein n=1 Tax=Cercophora newfieldiana TaxID=92897 RepID=A0AA39XTA0_9PEZI|nr:hypothetical protein B0T16DRAFT_395482 [Cercophora newfieldiana]